MSVDRRRPGRRARAGAAAARPPRAPAAIVGCGRSCAASGRLLITLGVVVLLFVVYEVYVTDLFGAQKQAAATEAVDQVWASAEVRAVTDTVVVAEPRPAGHRPAAAHAHATTPTLGEGFAKLYVPAFGADYVFTVIEGTDPDDLYIGPGHYPDTQLPGQQGNFAVAGHRVSKGSPFNDLGLLASCDADRGGDPGRLVRLPGAADGRGGRHLGPARRAPQCDGRRRCRPAPTTGVYGREITLPATTRRCCPCRTSTRPRCRRTPSG